MLFGVGCTPDGGETAGDEAMAEIAVNPTSFATTLEGGEQVITVTSNATWTVSCDQADVTVEPLTGNGNGQVTITVPAAAAREFKVVFDAQKQTTIPALGTSTTTTAKAEVTVSQNEGGVNQSNFLYYEDCGEDVEKNEEGYWPYIDKFEGWNPQGDAAANVTYKGGNASVRDSGPNYDPTADAVGISGAPYVFLNKKDGSVCTFVIEGITVAPSTQYMFLFNASAQVTYDSSAKLPSFAAITKEVVTLEFGYDGVNWDTVDFTSAPNGGNGWYAVTSEFKTGAEASRLFVRYKYSVPNPENNNAGFRIDDFKLVEGGSGAEITPDVPEIPTEAMTLPYSETFKKDQGYFVIENVVLPQELAYVWTFDEAYGMKGTAFVTNKYAAESWLLSPMINLSGATTPVLTFSHCVNKMDGAAPADYFTVNVRAEGVTDWTPLTIPTHGTGSSWDFVESGYIDLTAYVGKNVQIGFKYTSTTAVAGTWEIKNFKVAEKPAEVVVPEGTNASITFSEKGYANAEELEGKTISIDDNVSCQFFKNSGSTSPKYYTTGNAARLYGNNTLVINSTKTIKYVKFTFSAGQSEANLTSDGYNADSRVWMGESKSITFTQSGSTGHTRIQKIELVYAE